MQSASGAKRAPLSASRSSELAATPPTTAIVSCPVASAAASVRSASARTIDRWYEAARSARSLLEPVAEVASRVEQRGLHAREGEVEAVEPGDGEREGRRVAALREPVELGAAGIAEAEQPSALVERLAGGVVECRSEHLEAAALADVEQQRVPTAREQAEKRRLHRVGLEVERRDMPVEMVDRDERQPLRPRERLRRREADEQRADEPRALRHRDAVDVVERRSGLAEGLSKHRRHELELAPRGHLGDDPAVAGVELGLRGDDARADLAVDGDEGGGRLVAGRLEPEDHPASARPCTGSRHMITASSRLSV